MKKQILSTDDSLVRLISMLNEAGREKKALIWKDLAKRVSSSRKNRTEINVGRIGRNSNAKDVVVIPGKILGSGVIGHPVTVAGLSFSDKARGKITEAGGRCISFEDLVNENPKGSNVKIMRGV